jgi:hypothetical protein
MYEWTEGQYVKTVIRIELEDVTSAEETLECVKRRTSFIKLMKVRVAQ